MICPFCNYEHSNEGDRYGCPDCNGDGLEDEPEKESEDISPKELDVV